MLIIPDMKSLQHFLHRMARYAELQLKKLDLWHCPEAGLLLAIQRWRESTHAWVLEGELHPSSRSLMSEHSPTVRILKAKRL